MKYLLQEQKNKPMRFIFIYCIILLFFGILIINLVQLQVVKGNENLYLSSAIKTSESVIIAPRGLIYDRNDQLLVSNKPAFQLVVNLTELPREKEKDVIRVLSTILGVDEQTLWNDYVSRAYLPDLQTGEKQGIRSKISQIYLMNDIERDKVVSISARHEELPGIYIETGTTREYAGGKIFAHIVGYVQGITAGDYAKGGYSVGDIIGATGIEQYYDDELRGVNGRRLVENNRDDVKIRELIPVEAKAGKSIKLSLDSQIQEKLTESLQEAIQKNNATAGVAIIEDITNGELIALVSLPSFDPNQIVKGLTLEQYVQLSQDPTLPLYNRAISLNQPPGSTFKTIVLSAALQKNAISPQTVFESTGCMDLGGGFKFCEAGGGSLGRLDASYGLARSSNIYFCNTMLRLGIDNLNEFTDDFGLAQLTGIDLPSEQKGSVASRDLKMKLEGEQWYPGDACNTAIGQGLTRVSPIQMVSWIASIANGGSYYKPHLATSILNEDGSIYQEIKPEIIHTLPVDAENLKFVRDSMRLAVTDPRASAHLLSSLKMDVAAKTGSAETLRKVNGKFVRAAHSWITGFYPYSRPKYAFVVYLEYGGWGYQSAQVIKDYLEWEEGRK